MMARRTLDAPDPYAPTPGQTLARELGDAYPHVFAEVTGVPLWADEAPLARCRRKWEAYARRMVAATPAEVRRRHGLPPA